MSEILDNIYIWVFLLNSKSVLLLAFVKYMLCSHFTQNCIFRTFWRLKFLVLWRKIVQNLLMFVYLLYPNLCILMLCRLVHNMRSHFNELILAWKTYLDVAFIVPSQCSFPKIQFHVIKRCCVSTCTSVKRNKVISNWRLLIFLVFVVSFLSFLKQKTVF